MRFILFCISILLLSQISAQTYGCRDSNANNYNPNATVNDGSCVYSVTNYTPAFVTNLDAPLNESSALLIDNDKFWTLNDSGNLNVLFQVSSVNGAVLRRVIISNAVNTDWESIAQSDTHLFIGDFGNNYGTRKNLRILKISKNDLTNSKNDSVNAEFIDFSYSDQTTFSSALNANNFDGEALIYANDSLHIFSKNWVDLNSKHYRLSANAGREIATLQEELNVEGLISDATISPETGNVVLLGYKKSGLLYSCFSWLLSDYHGSNFFGGNKRLIELGSSLSLGQTEGISFKSGNSGFFTSEKVTNSLITIPSKLHSFNFNNYFGSVQASNLEVTIPSNRIYPNPCTNQLTIERNECMEAASYTITTIWGSMVAQGELSMEKNVINLNSLCRGSYFVCIEGNVKQVVKLIKL